MILHNLLNYALDEKTHPATQLMSILGHDDDLFAKIMNLFIEVWDLGTPESPEDEDQDDDFGSDPTPYIPELI